MHTHRPAALLLTGCALVLVGVVQVAGEGHEDGCGRGTTQQTCPVFFRTVAAFDYFEWDNVTGARGEPYHLDEPQEVPCHSSPATCYENEGETYTCDPGMRPLDWIEVAKTAELKPGSPAVCGHGNREFSFFVRRGKDQSKIILVLATGGVCWDAETCGNVTDFRTMAMDSKYQSDPTAKVQNLPDTAPAISYLYRRMMTFDKGDVFRFGIFSFEDLRNGFRDWSVIIVPDCTGDMHAGNKSTTYNHDDPRTCITTHHRGGVNTGLAVRWILDNFVDLNRVLVLGTGMISDTQAWGGHGAAFWAGYMQSKFPSANVRTLLDSSLGIVGPRWKQTFQNDPWGTLHVRVPDWRSNAPSDRDMLLPDRDEWFIADDDFTAYYEWAVARHPGLVFADASTVDDAAQLQAFRAFGGLEHDCCLEGCSCPGAPLYGERGGRNDWTKSRKVTVLRRHMRLGQRYRSWLLDNTDLRSVVQNSGIYNGQCPRFDSSQGSVCPPHAVLRTWLFNLTDAPLIIGPQGQVLSTSMTGRTYAQRAFGDLTCFQCLDGVPGTFPTPHDLCNATLYPGESLFTVAAKYDTDWKALWSLNGDMTPDGAAAYESYRFGHEYHVQHGDTLEAIAARFGTSAEALVSVNSNGITHIANPRNLGHAAVICVVPKFTAAQDHFGLPICRDPSPPFGARNQGLI